MSADSDSAQYNIFAETTDWPLCDDPVASLIINVTEERVSIENVAPQKMLPKPGNLFEPHLYNVV